ncbi:alpha/beta fold hydrolase [Dyella amyloliquefaciens]|uniref:alpha/beta fold hydrolase n=1 Tax=Dyella amyloliquefaciens TaxID=1770545 RepID=UPI00197AC022|nr:alpha/beta fold hydrolase [Dyella amyloliquefaciens]
MTALTVNIATRDGAQLALTRVGREVGAPVVLTHGTFSNHRTCMALAEYLARRGFACWVFDWRGHGFSAKAPTSYTFDTVAREDVEAVINAVGAKSGMQRIYWVGHSGGGLVAAMWMARNPVRAASEFGGLVLLASQATAAALTWRNRILVQVMTGWIACGGRLPGWLLRVGPEGEERRLMQQWCRWSLSRTFTGEDGFDYQRALGLVKVPVLALAGSGDTFIAPAQGCATLVSGFAGTDHTYRLCGRDQGFREDYTHDRLILSRNAARETWPLVEQWLAVRGALPA